MTSGCSHCHRLDHFPEPSASTRLFATFAEHPPLLVVTFRHFWSPLSATFRHFSSIFSAKCSESVVIIATLSLLFTTCRHLSPLLVVTFCHFLPLSATFRHFRLSLFGTFRYRLKLAAAHIPNLLKSINDWWTQMGRDSCLELLCPGCGSLPGGPPGELQTAEGGQQGELLKQHLKRFRRDCSDGGSAGGAGGGGSSRQIQHVFESGRLSFHFSIVSFFDLCNR